MLDYIGSWMNGHRRLSIAAVLVAIVVVIFAGLLRWIPTWAALFVGALCVFVYLWLIARLRPNQTGVWWAIALFGGIAVAGLGGWLGWIPPWAAFSVGATWVVACLWLLALIDLLATRGKTAETVYVPLPFSFARLSWLAPFSIPVGFAIGLFAGHNWW